MSVDFAEVRVDVINYDGSLMKNWNHRKLLNYCAGSYCYNCYCGYYGYCGYLYQIMRFIKYMRFMKITQMFINVWRLKVYL